MTDMTPGDLPPDTVDAVSVIRHEERLGVDTETVAVERIRLKRVVVTEQRTFTVDVSHEELHLTRDPVTETSDSLSSPSPARSPIVVVLREEQVEIIKRIVPVEKVTLHVDTVTVDQDITESLRREHIDYTPPADSV